MHNSDVVEIQLFRQQRDIKFLVDSSESLEELTPLLSSLDKSVRVRRFSFLGDEKEIKTNGRPFSEAVFEEYQWSPPFFKKTVEESVIVSPSGAPKDLADFPEAKTFVFDKPEKIAGLERFLSQFEEASEIVSIVGSFVPFFSDLSMTGFRELGDGLFEGSFCFEGKTGTIKLFSEEPLSVRSSSFYKISETNYSAHWVPLTDRQQECFCFLTAGSYECPLCKEEHAPKEPCPFWAPGQYLKGNRGIFSLQRQEASLIAGSTLAVKIGSLALDKDRRLFKKSGKEWKLVRTVEKYDQVDDGFYAL